MANISRCGLPCFDKLSMTTENIKQPEQHENLVPYDNPRSPKVKCGFPIQ